MNPAEDTYHETAPFQIVCPACGRDSDAPDMEAVCGACKTRLDVALWPVDGPAILRELGETLAAMGPEGVALLDRYLQHRAGYREEWGRLTAEARPGPFGHYGIDLTEVRLAPAYPRMTTVDSRVLAAALEHPGRAPVGMLFAGTFKCAFSVDLSAAPAQGQILHLSVSHSLGLGSAQRVVEFAGGVPRGTRRLLYT